MNLAETMTEIQTAHLQIDQWGFGIPSRDEIDGYELSLSERIADLCLRLERAERERDDFKGLLGEAVETLRSAGGLDQTSPPGTRLWEAAVTRIRQLQCERDEALARCRELEKLQEMLMV